MVICSHYEARFCFPKINCLFFFLTSWAGLEYQAQCLWNMMLSFTSHLEHSWGYRFLWFSAFWNGQWEMVCWDLKRLHGFLRQRRAEAIILPISPGSCLPLIGFMGCFSVCSCCSWVIEVDVWTQSCRSCALSLRGLLTFLLWSRTLLVFQKPGIRILSCPKGKKKKDPMRFYRFSLSWGERESEIWVWWTEYPGVSLALQEVETWLYKEWLKVSYLEFYLQ